jgi:hypothetical protein
MRLLIRLHKLSDHIYVVEDRYSLMYGMFLLSLVLLYITYSQKDIERNITGHHKIMRHYLLIQRGLHQQIHINCLAKHKLMHIQVCEDWLKGWMQNTV